MNELPILGSLRLRKGFWNSYEANIVTRYKGMYGERFYQRPKSDFCERLWLFRRSFIIHR